MLEREQQKQYKYNREWAASDTGDESVAVSESGGTLLR